jgi:hypothetical protein
MSTKLINVRLAAEDASKAEALRAQGIEISNVVREAIRAEYARRVGQRRTVKNVRRTLQEIYQRHPVPEDLPSVDTTNRAAAHDWILQQLKRKRIKRAAPRKKTSS